MRRQLLSLGIGVVVATLCTTIDYRHFERFAAVAFAIVLLAIGITMVIAQNTRGSQSWLLRRPRAALRAREGRARAARSRATSSASRPTRPRGCASYSARA
jgi:hypothetical protein